MNFLVEMKLSSSLRPMTPPEGIAFIEQVIFPTLERCKRLQAEKRILAGGPVSGTVGLVLIVDAESAQHLDELIATLPAWSRMETRVTPLTSFEGRSQTLAPLLQNLKTQVDAPSRG